MIAIAIAGWVVAGLVMLAGYANNHRWRTLYAKQTKEWSDLCLKSIESGHEDFVALANRFYDFMEIMEPMVLDDPDDLDESEAWKR